MLIPLTTLLFTIILSQVSAQDICQASPYSALSCLSSSTSAARYCTSSLPWATTSTTSTTTVLAKATVSTSQQATSQATDTTVSYESSTVTITTGSPSTATVTSTSSIQISAVLTTYVPAALINRRADAPVSTCGLGALTILDGDSLSTACLCIGVPAPTTTVTYYVTSYVQSTATAFDGLAPTTTAFLISRITFTEYATPTPTTVTEATSTTITTTSTVSLAAPTYDAAWTSSDDGCADVAASSGYTLDNSVTSDEQAVGMCQDICTQDPSCQGLFVQRLMPGVDGISPFYQCFINDHYFDSTDVTCDNDEGIYGSAVAYDACDRGVS